MKMLCRWSWCCPVLAALLLVVLVPTEVSSNGARADEGLYNLGVGIHDITGPSAGVNLMGYANPAQVNKGIHMRLFARSYIIDDGITRFVFVSADLGMMAQDIKIGVVDRLLTQYDGLYNTSNVVLSGTHTHSGPAGYLQYLLFDITSLGFIRSSYDAIVEGIVQSITRAHDSMVLGRLFISSGELLDASINRSPAAYLNNPEEERAQYEYDTDKTMTLLRLVGEDGTDLGLINWFAVHPTSMNNTNKLVSGDNKGYASQLFEKMMNPGAMPGEGKFVAAFAQSNCGDVSPNTEGPKCQNTGEPCDILTSTCDGRVHFCYASGPGKDMEESTQIIGTKQYEKALELFHSSTAVAVTGPVQVVAQQMDMVNHTVLLPDGSTGRTCKPALGFSFAAGTTDGPGAFDFTQGMTETNPFWSMIVNFIYEVQPDQIDCHDPKPILLDTGNYNLPYAWHPHVVETQVARVGQLVIAAVPGEFTTMSGRRIRDAISSTLAAEGVPDTVPVVAGLSNVYSHYIATNEEYAVQRYEGASTIFGPHTLSAYIQQYTKLASAMVNGEVVPPGPSPPNMVDTQLTLLPGVIFDGTSFGYSFGDVLAEPYPFAYSGETIFAKFAAGHPRNDPMLGGSFLAVEQQLEDGSWALVATDADWSTKFRWERTSTLMGSSVATVSWTIPEDTPEGTFRIRHQGHYKPLMEDIVSYNGTTKPFKVAPQAANSILIERRQEQVGSVGGLSWLVNKLFGR